MIFICPCGGPNHIYSGPPYRNAKQLPGICSDCHEEGRRARQRAEFKLKPKRLSSCARGETVDARDLKSLGRKAV